MAIFAAGQVVKAGTFLTFDSTRSKVITHPGIAETATAKFTAALTVGQTLIMAGLTFTATVGGASIAQLVAAWRDRAASSAYTTLSAQTAGTGNLTAATNSTSVTFASAQTFAAGTALFNGSGTFVGILASAVTADTSGTLTANAAVAVSGAAFKYHVPSSSYGGFFSAGTLTDYATTYFSADTVMFVASAIQSNTTDVAATGTGTAPTITVNAGSSTVAPIAGVAMYDVDATSADVKAAIYTEASFYAIDDGNDWLRWANDPAQTIINKAGTAVTCTAYNTGCFGTSDLQKQKKYFFVNGSEFCDIQTDLEVV